MTINHTLAIAAGLAIGLAGTTAPASAAPPASSFTYQGSLNQNGSPVNGQRDMRFRLYNVETGGSPIQTIQVFNVEMTNGLFSVEVDFGASAWVANDQYWVEIEAGPADQSQSYEVIGRQKLTAAPYALNTRGISVDNAGTTSVGSTLRLTNANESTWSMFSGSLGRFGIQDTTGSATRLIIDAQGDVGIGTTDPASKLDVVGSGRFSGNGTFGGNGSFSGNVGIGFAGSPTARLDVDGTTKLRGNVAIGNITPTTALDVDGAVTIRGGADIVEGFESICDTAFEPGTVLVIDPANPGMLMCAEGAYDKKVAGVVSGAGGVQPGIKLGQSGVLDGDIPVAMTGRVYVKCSAESGEIEPGDLLTTASLAGHAMKATDDSRSNGTVIGKAMGSLDSGEGLVLVLVNLQ